MNMKSKLSQWLGNWIRPSLGRLFTGGVILFFTLASAVMIQSSQINGALAQGGPVQVDSVQVFASTGAINFQGQLTDSVTGNTIADGDYNMRFAIYDAAISGVKKWPSSNPYEEQTGVIVIGGLLNVQLGVIDPITAGVFNNGGARYLQIWVCTTAGIGCTTYDDLGRLPISSAAYAQNLAAGSSISGSATTGAVLRVDSTATTGGAAAITVVSKSPDGSGIAAYNDSSGIGVYGRSSSGTGVYGRSDTGMFGVWGIAKSASGITFGVYGGSESTDGYGVWGHASSTTGSTYGVLGQSDSASGIGVSGQAPMTGTVGIATATTSLNYGVYGQSNSAFGRGVTGSSPAIGVEGIATSATSFNVGVYGQSESVNGQGVSGFASATNGVTYGVSGSSVSTDGFGVYGRATALTGTTYGVYGKGYSAGGYGVYGTAPMTGTVGIATDVNGTGVYGLASAKTGRTTGVVGEIASTWGTGVYGLARAASGDTTGVFGEIASTGGTGVYGLADAKTGLTTGVVGVSFANSGYGGYFVNGNGGGALYARSTGGNGNIIEAWSSTLDREFYISNKGNVYADGTFNPGGADFAEMLPAVTGLEPGDVLVIGPDGTLTRSTEAYQPTVAGVYSTRPGFLGGAGEGADLTGQVPLAVIGVVPVKVSAENGAIQPGDLLTTSDTPGHAMLAQPITIEGFSFYPSGVIIGKALEGWEEGTGIIMMLVVLQ